MNTLKKILCIAMASLFAFQTIAAHAGITDMMHEMFTKVGLTGNVNSPGAFQGQTMGTFTGGSLYMRAPNKSFQPFSFKPPSLKGGCGGIDMYLGSFSFFSTQQLLGFLESIMTNLVGFAFQLALDAISALIGVNLKNIFDQLMKFLNQSTNSCQMAQYIVDGTAGQLKGQFKEACARMKAREGGEDQASGNYWCQTKTEEAVQDAKTSPNTEKHERICTPGNRLWEQLKKITDLTDQDRRMIMSILGAKSMGDFHDETPDPSAPSETVKQLSLHSADPTIKSVKDILWGQYGPGDAQNTTPLADRESIRIEVLSCDSDPATCIDPQKDSEIVESFQGKVRTMLKAIAANIRNRTVLTATEADKHKAFVNTTSLPVWSLLSAANPTPAFEGVSNSIIDNITDYVALDYAMEFLNGNIKKSLTALAKVNASSRCDYEEKAVAWYSDNASRFMLLLQAEKQNVSMDLQSKYLAMGQFIEQLRRFTAGTMPGDVMAKLQYSKNATAGFR